MSYFRELEPGGQVAILVVGGVYQQAPLYTRAGLLFAKVGNGFVRLSSDGSTSKPTARIDALICDVPLFKNTFGHLCDASVPNAKPLPGEQKNLLIGVSE